MKSVGCSELETQQEETKQNHHQEHKQNNGFCCPPRAELLSTAAEGSEVAVSIRVGKGGLHKEQTWGNFNGPPIDRSEKLPALHPQIQVLLISSHVVKEEASGVAVVVVVIDKYNNKSYNSSRKGRNEESYYFNLPATATSFGFELSLVSGVLSAGECDTVLNSDYCRNSID